MIDVERLIGRVLDNIEFKQKLEEQQFCGKDKECGDGDNKIQLYVGHEQQKRELGICLVIQRTRKRYLGSY